MIRNETFQDGVCIRADIVDRESGIVTIEENGVVVGQRPMVDADIATILAAEKVEAETQARAAALAKLQALGLTEAEAAALFPMP